MAVLPMFPLGTVLLPSMVLPLHVFEPRYRDLTRVCLAGDRRFGVVLIERGSEVGGGDVRTGVGTIAEIVEAEELDDGRWVLVTVGTERILVERWLDDAPYPRAEVAGWTDDPSGPVDLTDVRRLLSRARALAAELGASPAPLDVELSDDPGLATFQVAALAPLGPADRHRVLATGPSDGRAALLEELLGERIELLRAQLGG